jgi:hypothetical protein
MTVPELAELEWGTPAEVERSLQSLYEYSEGRVGGAIAWYENKKRWKARLSQWLRGIAIVLTTAGGLVPIVLAIGWLDGGTNTEIGQLGYLFLGLAAGAVAIDRFFGLSSGWMRFITTMLELQKLLSEFRLDWVMGRARLAGKPPTPEQTQVMLQRLRAFIVAVDQKVNQETQTWISEFKASLADLDRQAKQQLESTRPGAIDVTITNGMEFPDGVTVALDGMVLHTVRGTRYQIGYVPPGQHTITAMAVKNGTSLEASELVTAVAGEVAKATLALPTEEAQP